MYAYLISTFTYRYGFHIASHLYGEDKKRTQLIVKTKKFRHNNEKLSFHTFTRV